MWITSFVSSIVQASAPQRLSKTYLKPNYLKPAINYDSADVPGYIPIASLIPTRVAGAKTATNVFPAALAFSISPVISLMCKALKLHYLRH